MVYIISGSGDQASTDDEARQTAIARSLEESERLRFQAIRLNQRQLQDRDSHTEFETPVGARCLVGIERCILTPMDIIALVHFMVGVCH